MVRLFLIISSLLLVFPCWATDYTQDGNCVTAWLFDEGAGETLDNAQGDANYDGTFLGAGEPVWSVDVPDAYAAGSADFDGNNDEIDCGTTALGVTDSITIVIWAKVEGSQSDGRIITKHLGDVPNYGWVVRQDETNHVRFSVVTDDDAWSDLDTANNTLPDNTWVHIAITYDTANVKAFLGGVESTDTEGPAGRTGDLQDLSQPLFIGFTGRGSGYHEGPITESAIFSRALNSTELNDIIDNGLEGAVAVARRIFLVM